MPHVLTLSKFRSPRLQEKAAFAAVRAALARSKIPEFWIFDNELWTLRVENEYVQRSIQLSPFAAADPIAAAADTLPENNFTEEQVWPAFRALGSLEKQAKGPIERGIIMTAIFRFLHGPGRVLLKKNYTAEVIQQVCYDVLAECEAIHFAYLDDLMEAADELSYLLHMHADYLGGHDIFHGY
jgi:hypothetical protein